MSNIAKLYSDAVGLQDAKDSEIKSEIITDGYQEMKWNWLNSSITQEVFKSIVDDENKLLDFAIEQACKSQPDHTKILQILVRVDTLRKLRKDFSNQPNQKQKPNLS